MNAPTIWETYQERRDPELRERLLEENLPLVHHVARQMTRTLSVEAEFDDLVSAGTIGLINAIENFDPSRGLAFSTFAAPRIRGAILDDLRRWDHVPRSVRRKQRALNAAREELRNTLVREPKPEETARALGIDLEKLYRWEADAQEAVHLSLDRPIEREGTARSTPLNVLIGEDGEAIEEGINHAQELERLKEGLLQLTERERLVLTLYYYEDLKLHEIAKVLDLTESRISQIRSKALKSLRAILAPLREESR